MACSTLKSGCTEQTIVHSPVVTDISPSVNERVLSKISSFLGILRPESGTSVLVQFWAAKKIGNIHVLTTTYQPFGLFGINKGLKKYYQSCLDQKHYAFRDATKEAALGLAGRVFLYCTPVQTQDVHAYHTNDHCTPLCKYAIGAKMGSFAVPVIDANQCVGVLEFVMDTLRDYNNDILKVQSVLECVGLQTANSLQSDGIKRTYICPKGRSRVTYTSPVTWYCCLAPLFGLSSNDARKILSELIGCKRESTFANIRKNVGIPEWPYIRNTTTRASNYVPEIQINETIPVADLISNGWGEEFSESSWEQTITSYRQTWPCERPDAMPDFGEMEHQESNAQVMYHDSMDMMKIRSIYRYPDADIISIWDYGFSEQTMTSDAEPCIESRYACPDFMESTHGMERRC